MEFVAKLFKFFKDLLGKFWLYVKSD
ncbi:alpha-3 family phenol-soluble modulin [Staphylococcus aureus]|nr:alpha-3 family phenol-soluble modulin [Staphylococcus aureus]